MLGSENSSSWTYVNFEDLSLDVNSDCLQSLMDAFSQASILNVACIETELMFLGTRNCGVEVTTTRYQAENNQLTGFMIEIWLNQLYFSIFMTGNLLFLNKSLEVQKKRFWLCQKLLMNLILLMRKHYSGPISRRFRFQLDQVIKREWSGSLTSQSQI